MNHYPGIVIIGAGECGVHAAFRLKTEGYSNTVTLINGENVDPYERPPLSKSQDSPLKAIREKAAYEEAGIDLVSDVQAVSLDPQKHTVLLSNGNTLPYAKLLIATGARPRLFPGMETCLTLRTADDAARIRERLNPGSSLAVIGGGFIGLELAAAARSRGLTVSVYEAASRLMARAVPAAVADFVYTRHITEGVKIHTDAVVASADANRIMLKNREPLVFDTVVAGVGAVPNTALAEAAGLTVSNGIVVDAALQTSDPDIYAAGDCCNFPYHGRPLRLESWKAAQDQGAHAALSMLGEQKAYDSVPWFWSDQYDLTLQAAGIFEADVPVQTRHADDDTCIVFQCRSDNRLTAAAGVGTGNATAKDIRIFEKLIGRGEPVDPGVIADSSQNLKRLLRAN